MSYRSIALLVLLVLPLPARAQSATLLRLANASSADRALVDSAGIVLLRGGLGGAPQNPTGWGALLMWLPGKRAFRAGYVGGSQWDDTSVGLFSVAMGFNTSAPGSNAVALGHTTVASGYGSFAGGLGSIASGNYSTAMGTSGTASGQNSVSMGNGALASGTNAVAIGSSVTASATSSTALGFATVASGVNSTAMGSNASTAGFPGAFVYGDNSTPAPLTASTDNQFNVRASGGVRLFTTPFLGTGVTLLPGGSSWNVVSDRRRKERFLAVSGEEVLDRVRGLPISTWRYIAEGDRTIRHIGPMAQEWRAAFGFSPDSTTINSGDFDGVNLAAAQALTARTDRLLSTSAVHAEQLGVLLARVTALQLENSELRAALAGRDLRDAELEARLRRIELRSEAARP